MHTLLPTFQRRADLILHGQIDLAVDGYMTPFWCRFRGQFFHIATREELWEMLSRQHLSQMARGIVRIVGEMEEAVSLAHGALRVTVHWQETSDTRGGDTARWFRTVYVCRQAQDALRVVGLTLTETRRVSEPFLPRVFPSPCEDW